jgi:hypothetical protein
MRKRARTQVWSLMAATVFVSIAVGAEAPADAQRRPVITQTNPTAGRWLDQWLGVQTGGRFVLAAATDAVQVASLNQPRRFRVCITVATPATPKVQAKVVTESVEVVIPVGYCSELDARWITVVPATALGRTQQVRGYHEIVLATASRRSRSHSLSGSSTSRWTGALGRFPATWA